VTQGENKKEMVVSKENERNR